MIRFGMRRTGSCIGKFFAARREFFSPPHEFALCRPSVGRRTGTDPGWSLQSPAGLIPTLRDPDSRGGFPNRL